MLPFRSNLRSVVFAASALLVASVAHAQSDGASPMALQQLMFDGVSRSAETQVAPELDTSVGADPQVSAQAKQAYLDKIRAAKGEAAARPIDDFFTQNPIRTVFTRVGEPYGLNPDSYRDVLAAWMLTMWLTANNAPQLPTQAQVDGVRRQTDDTLKLQGIPGTQAERQLQAESMMYEVVSAIAARQEAEQAGNRAALESLSASTHSNLQQRGLNFQALALDDNGLRPR